LAGVREPDPITHFAPPVFDPETNTYLHGDGAVEYPDGRLQINGYVFEAPDWDKLDPPTGHPDGDVFTHEEVMTEMCEFLDLPAGSL
jgi:hypothetical protein